MSSATDAEVLKGVTKDAVRETLMEMGIDPALHAKHHAFIDLMIERHRARKELIQWAKKTTVGIIVTAVIAGLVGVFHNIGEWVLQRIGG